MTLSTAVCSITATQRRRFFWAAWWTSAPQQSPFRKPDASNGGARTEAEGLAEAQRVAGRHLVLVEPYWARAWNRVLRGEAPPPPPRVRDASAPPRPRPSDERASSWAVLGLAPGAPFEDVKRMFRKRALETHPDQGGDPDVFREVRRAYERLAAKLGERA
jgi:hypothetical protein